MDMEATEASVSDIGIKQTEEKENVPTQEVNEVNIGLRKYEVEWRQLSSGVDEVRRLALTGALRASRLRSLAWALLLGVIPTDSSEWLNTIRLNRQTYTSLREKLACDPRCCEQPEDDPLSQKDESIWNQHFRDTELQTVIKLDVVRTFPGVEFFKQSEIQETMVNVLFCFARETPQLVYRQGMHEILAPLLFVLQSDQRAAEHTTLGDELNEIMDPDFLEHDSYILFKTIMLGIESFYRINDLPSNVSMYTSSTNKACNVPPTTVRRENEVVKHLALIRDRILIPQDPELADHLQQCDIALSLFGIRWLRVLFGREFPLHDLLVLWDSIFAEGDDFSLAGYVMVAMLIAIRSTLINNDAMVCLTNLMHYPTTVDVQYIIDHALYLKDPLQYLMPASNPFCCSLQPQLQQKPKTPKKDVKSKHKVSSSKDDVKETVPNLKIAGAIDESGVIDGYTLQDPELLQEELAHARNVMSLCQLKLEQYELVLSHALPPTLGSSHPAYQALGGMRELCNLLRSQYHIPLDVEPALEANESGNHSKSSKERSRPQSISEDKKVLNKTPGNRQPKTSNPKEVALKVFHLANSTDKEVKGAPSQDPLGIRTQ